MGAMLVELIKEAAAAALMMTLAGAFLGFLCACPAVLGADELRWPTRIVLSVGAFCLAFLCAAGLNMFVEYAITMGASR